MTFSLQIILQNMQSIGGFAHPSAFRRIALTLCCTLFIKTYTQRTTLPGTLFIKLVGKNKNKYKIYVDLVCSK